MTDDELLTDARIADALNADERLDGWRLDDHALVVVLRTRGFRRGLEVVARIGEAAEEAGHHPDILLTYGRVRVTLTTHDAGGVTERDVRLARAVSAIAAELGVEPDRNG